MKTRHLFFFLIIWLGYSALVHRFWFVGDDAYISFRYAKNLAQGYGLRYNLGPEIPVEGYSNLSWVLISALVEYWKLDPTFYMPLLSFLCGSLLLFLVYKTIIVNLKCNDFIAIVSTLTLALFPPFALWSSGGLETMLFALLLFILFSNLFLAVKVWPVLNGALALLLALTRPEGLIWVLCLFVFKIFSDYLAGKPQRESYIALSILLAGVLTHMGLRYLYYHEFVPNTVHAKSSLSHHTLTRGLRYLALFYLTYPGQIIFLLTALALVFGRAKQQVVVACCLVILTAAWSVFVGGDFMAMGRFFVQSFAFQTIILAYSLKLVHENFPKLHFSSSVLNKINLKAATSLFSILLIACHLLPAWNKHLFPRSTLAKLHFRYNVKMFHTEFEQWQLMKTRATLWKTLGNELKKISRPGDSLAIGAIGAVGYYSDLYIYDTQGLVSKEVAKQKKAVKLKSPGHDLAVSTLFFANKNPEFIYANIFSGKNSKYLAYNAARALESRSTSKRYAPRVLRSEQHHSAIILVLQRLPENSASDIHWHNFYKQLMG